MQPPPIGLTLLSLSPSEASIPSARILSDTAPKPPFADVPQELFQRFLYEVRDTLEAHGVSEKGTHDLPLRRGAYLTIQKHAKQHSLRFRTVLTDHTAELELATDAAHSL